MTYRALVLDIDGTLTNQEKKITPRNKAAVKSLLERGIPIILASGRPTAGVMPLAHELSLQLYGGYVLAFNGAKLIDCKSGRTIFERVLPPGKVPQIVDFAKENGAVALSYENDNTVITEQPDDPYVQMESKLNRIPIKKVENLVDYITFPAVKCLLVGDGERMALLEELSKKEIGEGLSIYRSEPYFLEMMPQGVDKASALKELISTLGIAREELVVCGDGFNDLSMIRFAGLGIAMANAQEVVKQAADYITASNEEDGVALAIDRFFS